MCRVAFWVLLLAILPAVEEKGGFISTREKGKHPGSHRKPAGPP